LLRDNEDAVEADFHRYYNLDLAELYRGELSLRKVSNLIANLPTGSATWSAINDIPYGWTLTDLLIADLFHAFSGEPHPARPNGKKPAASRAKELAERLMQQRERLNQN
jgi:hypothetical protein